MRIGPDFGCRSSQCGIREKNQYSSTLSFATIRTDTSRTRRLYERHIGETYLLAAQSTVERQTSYGGALGDVFRALKFLSISSGTTIIGRRNWTRHVFIAAALFALDTTACLSSPHTAQYVVVLIC